VKRARSRGENEAPRKGDRFFCFTYCSVIFFPPTLPLWGRFAPDAEAFCAAMKFDKILLSLTKI
jgi:hypothetical protein